MSIKIFHTADVHVGLKFAGRDYPQALQEELINERINVVERMVAMANDEKCDLFVVAGDLFDSARVSLSHVRKTVSALNKFAGELVLILPGNHDYIDNEADSKLWKTFAENAKENLLVILDRPDVYKFQIGDINLHIYAGPCTSKHSAENMIGWIDKNAVDKDAVNIGIAHGAVAGYSPDNEDKYFLMTEAELEEKDLDFWLLGHTHISYPDKQLVKPLFFMPSTPEPDGFDCRHDGFAWIINIDQHKSLAYKKVKTGLFRFFYLNRMVSSEAEIDSLRNELKNLNNNSALIKLKLQGRLSKEEKELLKNLENDLAAFKYSEFHDSEVALKIDRDFVNQRFTESSLPFRLLSELIDEQADPLTIEYAYNLLMEAKQ